MKKKILIASLYKAIGCRILLFFSIVLFHNIVYASNHIQGFVFDSYGKVVVDGFGDCIRTSPSSNQEINKICKFNLTESTKPTTIPPQDKIEPIIEEELNNVGGGNQKIIITDNIEDEKGNHQSFLTEIKFDFDQHKITEKAKFLLDKFTKKTNNISFETINILGHADAVGANNYNIQLSVKRAKAVKNYFTKNGVSGSKINITGFGESIPIADNKTRKGRAKNRRVSIELK